MNGLKDPLPQISLPAAIVDLLLKIIFYGQPLGPRRIADNIVQKKEGAKGTLFLAIADRQLD